ncbi:MAG: type II toxin-antitoxin system Phd/YefM family antitoxin [bacterium]|nr:type II toxin-antitoxin system Phd/YefM family antitoxin [bacterium]
MVQPLKSATASEMKNHFGDFLGEVVHGNRPVLIEKHGKPVAVMISFKEWSEKKTQESEKSAADDPWIKRYRKLMEELKKAGLKKPQYDAVEMVRKIREEET